MVMVVDDDNGDVGGPVLSYVSDDDDDNGDISDIYIMMKCLCVTKKSSLQSLAPEARSEMFARPCRP